MVFFSASVNSDVYLFSLWTAANIFWFINTNLNNPGNVLLSSYIDTDFSCMSALFCPASRAGENLQEQFSAKLKKSKYCFHIILFAFHLFVCPFVCVSVSGFEWWCLMNLILMTFYIYFVLSHRSVAVERVFIECHGQTTALAVSKKVEFICVRKKRTLRTDNTQHLW